MKINDSEFKKEINLGRYKSRYLLFGEERQLLVALRKKLEISLEKNDFQCEVIDAKEIDFDTLCENALVVPLFGGKRAFFVDNFDTDILSQQDFDNFLELCKEKDEYTYIIVTFAKMPNLKKNTRDKKLVAAFEKQGGAVEFCRRTSKILRENVRTICRRFDCELSFQNAELLVQRCGEDLGILKGECEKLCYYAGKGNDITADMVLKVTTQNDEANIFSLAGLMLKSNADKVLKEIDVLLAQKIPIAQIISNLAVAFSGLYCASSARAAGKTYEIAAKELHEKFSWRMRNYYRDSQGMDNKKIHRACVILAEAENQYKSGRTEERALLDETVIKCIMALKG